IAQVNQYLVVRDLGSTNGIRINDVRVLEGRLKAGDELTIGNFRYQLRWNDGEASDPAQVVSSVKPSLQPATHKPSPIVPASDDEDELLEPCAEPVPIGQRPPVPTPPNPPLPRAIRPPNGSSPVFPDEVNLARDSGSSPPAANAPH